MSPLASPGVRPIITLLSDFGVRDFYVAAMMIIHIDHFGNATTNLSADAMRGQPLRNVRIKGRSLGRLRRTYWDVPPGKALALIGSSGLLEIAIRDGSAASELGLNVGDEVGVG